MIKVIHVVVDEDKKKFQDEVNEALSIMTDYLELVDIKYCQGSVDVPIQFGRDFFTRYSALIMYKDNYNK